MSKDNGDGAIVRPGQTTQGERKSIGALSPDIQRMDGIKTLMKGEGTLARISKEQIILEAALNGVEDLGYKIPATLRLIRSARDLSPGLDGLGRGEAVKCLVAHAQNGQMFPASAFAQDQKPGVIQRLLDFVRGRNSQASSGSS